MKRGLVLALVVGVIVSVVAPAIGAAAGRQRTFESPYMTPAAGLTVGPNKAYFWDCQMAAGCAIIPLEKKDRFAKLEIDDTSGQDVFFSVYTMPGGQHLGDFCGSTNDAFPTVMASELLVHVVTGVCADGTTPSVGTTGIVRATLSRKDF